jgi:hypothetical protein
LLPVLQTSSPVASLLVEWEEDVVQRTGNGLCLRHLGLIPIHLGLGTASWTSFVHGCKVQQRWEHRKILVSGLPYRRDGAVAQGRRTLMLLRLAVGMEYLEGLDRMMRC